MNGSEFCRKLLPVLFLCLLTVRAAAQIAAGCGASQAQSFISYSIAPDFAGGHLALKVDLTFKLEDRFDGRSCAALSMAGYD